MMKEYPRIMGIINLTPDSFYDGGTTPTLKTVLKKVATHIEEGADIIDIGAYSSRPGAKHISIQEELHRIVPVVKNAVATFPDTIFSIDTFRSDVAKVCIGQGAHIINDISGGTMDSKMFPTLAELGVPYVLTHIQGTPQTMQHTPHYDNIVDEVNDFFIQKLKELRSLSIDEVILDVGFGFGKTLAHNYQLLKNLSFFKELKKPVLVGVSRKSMLYKVLESSPKEALNATSVAHTLALLNGADILRVHDVKEAVEVCKIVEQYLGNE